MSNAIEEDGNRKIPSHQDTAQLSFSELDRLHRIGSSAGAKVYKVVHRSSGRSFALKVIYGIPDDPVRHQIRRDIEILCGVSHPNVLRCHEIFEHNGEFNVLFEFMDGGSLQGTTIDDETQLSDVARQILSGIASLHRREIVHHAIKPSNLLRDTSHNVKITDIDVPGISHHRFEFGRASDLTIAYMSPERINTDLNQGQDDGYAGDIWSLGVCILEFYLGRFPLSADPQGDWASLMIAIVLSQPPEAPPSATENFRDFIACCLQKEPDKRWTAEQLLNHPFISERNGGEREVNQKLHDQFSCRL